MSKAIEYSVIVPVCSRHDKTGKLAEQYLETLKQSGSNFELIIVLDGTGKQLLVRLLELLAHYPMLRVIQLSKAFGESTALTVGVEHAAGTKIMTLPAYYQVEPSEIITLIDRLDDCDMVIAVRSPRTASNMFEKARRDVFHRLVEFFANERFHDLGCNARLMTRNVIEEISMYGDQHRFLPLLASRKGFRVRETNLRQSPLDKFDGTYRPKIYAQRLLDIFTIFFLIRFTKRPLRFFGMIGSITTIIGGVFLSYLVVERIFLDVALADRPALLLSSLLVVLGLQVFAIGLLGELIIFTHARDIKEYTIEKIIN